MKDPIKTIGQILTGNEERDAIHVAVLPVIADELLMPGAKVKVDNGKANQATRAESVGIIDPYLPKPVNKGQRCWVFLFPGSVTGMRHHWKHPVIDDPKKNESERWLRDFANKWNFSYEEMISEATAQIKEHASGKCPDWHYITARGIDLHSRSELGEDEERFWYHMSQLTGLVASPEDRESFGWSCTC